MFQTHAISGQRILSSPLLFGICLAAIIGITTNLLKVNTYAVAAIVVVIFLWAFIGSVISGPCILLWITIVFLAFLSSEPFEPLARAGLTEPGYNLFGRYFMDILSTWDILFFIMFAVLLLQSTLSPKSSRLTFCNFKNRITLKYFTLLLVAILIGFIIILTGQLYVFVFRDWARAIVPLIYLFLTYEIVVNFIKSRNNIQRTWRLFEAIAFAMVIYGLVRLKLILTGHIQTLWAFGMPIVLYSELITFDFPIILYILQMWNQRRANATKLFMVFAMIVYKLASTRRLIYINLVIYLAIAAILGRKAGLLPPISKVLVKSRWLIGILLIGAIIASTVLPGFLDAIGTSVSTLNIFSGYGYKYTGEFRLWQISSIFQNLSEKPVTWFTGYGIGSKWYTFKSMPREIDEVGSFMAFDAKVLSDGSQWLPYFHVPYFSTLFRFGFLGCLGLILIVRNLLTSYIRMIRSTPELNDRLCLLASLVMIPVPILLMGDSPTPIGYIWAGIHLGLLESYRIATLHISKRKNEQP